MPGTPTRAFRRVLKDELTLFFTQQRTNLMVARAHLWPKSTRSWPSLLRFGRPHGRGRDRTCRVRPLASEKDAH
eukprot:9485025-Lingulodinium_polyedra.AAC.1